MPSTDGCLRTVVIGQRSSRESGGTMLYSVVMYTNTCQCIGHRSSGSARSSTSRTSAVRPADTSTRRVGGVSPPRAGESAISSSVLPATPSRRESSGSGNGPVRLATASSDRAGARSAGRAAGLARTGLQLSSRCRFTTITDTLHPEGTVTDRCGIGRRAIRSRTAVQRETARYRRVGSARLPAGVAIERGTTGSAVPARSRARNIDFPVGNAVTVCPF
ncbi:hypothetical protein NJ7G_4002 [Natrinema sp. J7-2]|nr:hypothetical protein NJ7G_4002 [Natrinema sp. J7-2]